MAASNPTERFSSRVDNYLRYRPGYPTEVINLLHNECGLTGDSRVADIAYGTGIFTRLLLESGSRVFGVEPNAEMRRAGDCLLYTSRAINPGIAMIAGDHPLVG